MPTAKMAYVVVPLAGLLVAAGGQTSSNPGGASTQQSATAGAEGPRAGSRSGTPSPTGQGQRSWTMGNVIESKNDAVSINTENGRMLTLQVGSGTDVVVDGKRTSPRNLKLKPGADVFAAYEGPSQRATAVILEVDQTGRGIHGAPSRMGMGNGTSGARNSGGTNQ